MALALISSGCAIPPIVSVAKLMGDGALLMATGKSSTDHGLSAITGKDCAMLRALSEQDICKETVVAAAGPPPPEPAALPEPAVAARKDTAPPVAVAETTPPPSPVVSSPPSGPVIPIASRTGLARIASLEVAPVEPAALRPDTPATPQVTRIKTFSRYAVAKSKRLAAKAAKRKRLVKRVPAVVPPLALYGPPAPAHGPDAHTSRMSPASGTAPPAKLAKAIVEAPPPGS